MRCGDRKKHSDENRVTFGASTMASDRPAASGIGLYARAEPGESSAGGIFGWVEWEVNLRADLDLSPSSARIVSSVHAVRNGPQITAG